MLGLNLDFMSENGSELDMNEGKKEGGSKDSIINIKLVAI